MWSRLGGSMEITRLIGGKNPQFQFIWMNCILYIMTSVFIFWENDQTFSASKYLELKWRCVGSRKIKLILIIIIIIIILITSMFQIQLLFYSIQWIHMKSQSLPNTFLWSHLLLSPLSTCGLQAWWKQGALLQEAQTHSAIKFSSFECRTIYSDNNCH